MDQMDRDRLMRISNTLIETVTSPKVIEHMYEFRKRAAEGASLDEAGDLMSLGALRAAGADLPEDFRLTSRVFEDREKGVRLELKPSSLETFGGDVALGVCAGGGAGTVCGCAGGS